MRKLIIYKLAFVIMVTATPLRAQQTIGFSEPAHSLLNEFGYKLSLYSFGMFDSNILRRSPPKNDMGGLLYPSVELYYPISRSTRISAEYLYGINHMVSTSFLNNNSNSASFSLSNNFTPHLKIQLYSALKKSSQPDILNMNMLYTFATYIQNREGIKFDWIKTPATVFSIDFNIQQRSYNKLNTSSSDRQKDFLNSLEFSSIHAFTDHTLAFIQIGYLLNASNNPVYRYSEPYLKTYISQALAGGIKLEMLQKLENLRFSRRAVSNNPSLTRNDLIIETMFGIKKKINNFVSLNARYYFLKDYSNEPFRKINANTVILALEMSLQKKPSYIFKASDYAHLSDSTIYPTVEELRPEDLANIGYEFILKGQYDDAIKYNLKALSKDSTITEAHINLGIAYYKKGRLADAIREWKTALRLDPSNLKVRKLVEKAQAEEKVKNK